MLGADGKGKETYNKEACLLPSCALWNTDSFFKGSLCQFHELSALLHLLFLCFTIYGFEGIKVLPAPSLLFPLSPTLATVFLTSMSRPPRLECSSTLFAWLTASLKHHLLLMLTAHTT